MLVNCTNLESSGWINLDHIAIEAQISDVDIFRDEKLCRSMMQSVIMDKWVHDEISKRRIERMKWSGSESALWFLSIPTPPQPKINFGYYRPPRSFQSLRAAGPSYQNTRLKDVATANPPYREGLQMKEGWCATNSGSQKSRFPSLPPQLDKNNCGRSARSVYKAFLP